MAARIVQISVYRDAMPNCGKRSVPPQGAFLATFISDRRKTRVAGIAVRRSPMQNETFAFCFGVHALDRAEVARIARMEPVASEWNRILRLKDSGEQRVGERTGSGDHHGPIALLCLVIEDLLKLIGGQLWPISLRDHDRPLDHHGSIERSRGGTIDAERQKTITLLRRVITDADVLVERPSMPGNDVRHCMFSSRSNNRQKPRSPASAKGRRLGSASRHVRGCWIKDFLTRRVSDDC